MREGMVIDDENSPLDPLATEESPLAAPPRVPPPPTPVPDPEPIPLDEPAEPIILTPDRPDQDLAEPLADPMIPVDLPVGDPSAPPPPPTRAGCSTALPASKRG